MDSLLIPLALAAGALLTVQAGANAQLAKAIGSPFAATTLQLGVAALLLLLATALAGGLPALPLLANARWWHAIGGTASAFYVVSAILLFPRIGAVVSVGLFIAGQVLASMAIDALGLPGVAATGWSIAGVAGGALVMAGAALIVLGQQDAWRHVTRERIGWYMLALAAGAVLPVQGAVNALLRQDLGGATFAVGTVSFVVATLAMAAVQVAATAVPGASKSSLQGSVRGLSSLPWWGWLGGFAGATYVTTVFASIPAIGAAATVGLTVAGQQVASVFVDRYGWLRLPERPVSATRLMGVALLLTGIAVARTHG
jgi:transporter family-2 protein